MGCHRGVVLGDDVIGPDAHETLDSFAGGRIRAFESWIVGLPYADAPTFGEASQTVSTRPVVRPDDVEGGKTAGGEICRRRIIADDTNIRHRHDRREERKTIEEDNAADEGGCDPATPFHDFPVIIPTILLIHRSYH